MPHNISIQDTTLLTLELSPAAGPRYLQIADALEHAMLSGDLQPGTRLPPQRQLAQQLGVDLTTVTRAYDEAKRRHLLEGRGARGTYVAAPKVELAPVLDLSMNTPPPPEGVAFGDLLKRGLSQVLMRADNELLMTYHLGGGSPADRQAGATWLAPMFGKVDQADVLVCPGAQAALAALLLALTQPGDTILAEPTIYPGIRSVAAEFGRRIVTVATDGDGMRPDALEEACRVHGARLVYLNPTLQNPTTATMPAGRRRDLAAVARRLDLRIIEDDPYWLLADAPPPPLATFAPAHACYISTLSKCLTPGLRIAFVLVRDPALQERFLAALRSFALMAAPLTAALATQWIHDGSATELMHGVAAEARARQQMARLVLSGRDGATLDGLHVWLTLPAYWSSSDLSQVALREGLAVTPASVFCDATPTPDAIRISLGSIQSRKRLQAGLQRLSQLLARRQPVQVRPVI